MTNHANPIRKWRSLADLKDSAQFQDFLHREFPAAASEFPTEISRRRWLQLMGASFALAASAGCRWEQQHLAAFVHRPEGRVPGESEQFATAIEMAGAVRPLLVTSRDGRPVKVEGNSLHPLSRGASDAFSQAATLGLYDPDRSDSVVRRGIGPGSRSSWQAFDQVIRPRLGTGRGVRVLLDSTSSIPTRTLLEAWLKQLPEANFCVYSPLADWNAREGAVLAFGKVLRPQLDLRAARTVLSLDCDLLAAPNGRLDYANQFFAQREPEADWMSRLYAVESQFTLTGAKADHRLATRSSECGWVLAAITAGLDEREQGRAAEDILGSFRLSDPQRRFLMAVVDDLHLHRGESIVAVGATQPPEIHARVHALNQRLDNIGKTIWFSEDSAIAGGLSIAELAEEMHAGQVETLVILGGNPVYDAPAATRFPEALSRVKFSAHLSCYDDETSQSCTWHLPRTHAFEQWDAFRTADGLICVSQPLIEPLLGGKSTVDLLRGFCGYAEESMSLTRQAVTDAAGRAVNDREWRHLLHDGLLLGSEFPKVVPQFVRRPAASDDSHSKGTLEVVLTPSSATFDGSLANNGWLQETPDPLTKITWDNALICSPRTAEELSLAQGDIVELEVSGQTVQVPVFVQPGQADRSLGLALGYGRNASGIVGGLLAEGVEPVGVSAYPVLLHCGQFLARDCRVRKTGEKAAIATTQDHHAIDTLAFEEINRRVGDLVRETTPEELSHSVDHPPHDAHDHHSTQLWESPAEGEGHAWGMSIDLSKCLGCNACSVACQAENNVPIVGKEQILRGREMHWIRVDRYFTGDVSSPEVSMQPVACHHCENAPCEQVCPVAATVHSDEGLNDMVYNRCIGTRYCANNCPYKVRRFNFFDYEQQFREPGRELVQLAINPEVTVRSRGVMEKCTYCVQRIQHGKITARAAGRSPRDQEIQTACQQACPTRAIEFGDLNQPDSRVAMKHADRRAYAMLGELNVKPRTKYLQQIRNPHRFFTDAKYQTGRTPHGTT